MRGATIKKNYQKICKTAISTHAPLARCNVIPLEKYTKFTKFLLTHLLRGATKNKPLTYTTTVDFYSRTSCEVQQANGYYALFIPIISTHAPLARCNDITNQFDKFPKLFLLTHLLRGATSLTIEQVTKFLNFYSRTSCEVQRKETMTREQELLFLLTHLLRGATKFYKRHYLECYISTHVPLARCNLCDLICIQRKQNFYSRTSCEVQLIYKQRLHEVLQISTHAPLARCNSS